MRTAMVALAALIGLPSIASAQEERERKVEELRREHERARQELERKFRGEMERMEQEFRKKMEEFERNRGGERREGPEGERQGPQRILEEILRRLERIEGMLHERGREGFRHEGERRGPDSHKEHDRPREEFRHEERRGHDERREEHRKDYRKHDDRDREDWEESKYY